MLEPPVVRSVKGRVRLVYKITGKDRGFMLLSNPRSAVIKGYVALVSLMVATSVAYPGAAIAKRLSFQMPVQEKLNEGAGPVSAKPAPRKAASSHNLAPLGINGEEQKDDAGGLLKASASVSQVSARPPAELNSATGKSESVVGKGLGSKVLKDGNKVDVGKMVGPLVLHESDAESSQKADTVVDADKRQVAELWQSTIDRNPDIQFVITKLQPTGDANHAMANTMKMLSGALFGAMNLAPLALGGGVNAAANPAAMMGMGAGANLIQGLFVGHEEKNARKHQISQEQATILYKIVRDTADKLVCSFRDYKKNLVSMQRASVDLQDLQGMVAESRAGQDAAKQVEMEYTLRKARREIEKEMEDVRRHRQELSDLAGPEAVVKLETEMDDERMALEKLTGTDNPGNPTGPFKVPAVQLGGRATPENPM